MKRISFVFGLLYGLLCTVVGQGYVRIYPENKNIVPYKVASMYATGNLAATPSNKFLGFNVEDIASAKNGFVVSSFTNPIDVKNSILFTQPEGHLELVKMFGDGDYELFLFGMYQRSASDRYIFCANYNYRLQQLTTFRILDLPNDPTRILELKDVLVDGNQFYLLATTEVEYLSNIQQKVVLINYNGSEVLWSKVYNFIAPIHSESAAYLSFDPNGNIAVCGTIQTSGDHFERMMLMEIKSNGDPGVLKKIELLATNQTFSNRYGWTYVKNRGSNLHLFSQSVLGGGDPGQLLVTMFDVNYSLRTWRNYTIPVRAEFSMIESNFFYFGGQAPVGTLYDGYTMVKVNSSNAIVEAVRYFEKGIDNLDATTSSTACYDRANDKIWSAIKSNRTDDILVVENPSSLSHLCGSNLTSSVAKDTMRISDYSLAAKDLEIQASDYSAHVSSILMLSEEICRPTLADEPQSGEIKISYNELTKTVFVKLNGNTRCLILYDQMGRSHFVKDKFDVNEFELNCSLKPGMYFIRHISKTGLNQIVSFVVVD